MSSCRKIRLRIVAILWTEPTLAMECISDKMKVLRVVYYNRVILKGNHARSQALERCFRDSGKGIK